MESREKNALFFKHIFEEMLNNIELPSNKMESKEVQEATINFLKIGLQCLPRKTAEDDLEWPTEEIFLERFEALMNLEMVKKV